MLFPLVVFKYINFCKMLKPGCLPIPVRPTRPLDVFNRLKPPGRKTNRPRLHDKGRVKFKFSFKISAAAEGRADPVIRRGFSSVCGTVDGIVRRISSGGQDRKSTRLN